MPGKRTRSSSGGSAKRAPAAQAQAQPRPTPTAAAAPKTPSVVAFTTPLTGLRVLLPEGTVQFVDGRYETASETIAAGLERAAAQDPNLAIKKEK